MNNALKETASVTTGQVGIGGDHRAEDRDGPPQKAGEPQVHFTAADQDLNEDEEVNDELQSATETERFKQLPNTNANGEQTT